MELFGAKQAGWLQVQQGSFPLGTCSEETAAQIELDLLRCGRQELGVRDIDAEAHRGCLRRVLTAAAGCGIPYNQALGHVAAAVLVLSSHAESKSLQLLQLFVHSLPKNFYSSGASSRVCRVEVCALVELAEECAPRVFALHPTAVHEALSLIATDWLLKLWVRIC